MEKREVETVNISGLSDSEIAELIADRIGKIREDVASHLDADNGDAEEEEAKPWRKEGDVCDDKDCAIHDVESIAYHHGLKVSDDSLLLASLLLVIGKGITTMLMEQDETLVAIAQALMEQDKTLVAIAQALGE